MPANPDRTIIPGFWSDLFSGIASQFPRVMTFLSDSEGNEATIEHGALSVSTNEHFITTTAEYQADGTGNFTSSTVIAPSSGKYIGVFCWSLHTDSSAGEVNLDFSISGTIVGRLYATKNNRQSSGEVHIEGAVDEVLTISATGLSNNAKVFLITNTVEHT